MHKILSTFIVFSLLSNTLVANIYAAPSPFKSRNIQTQSTNSHHSDMEIRSNTLPTIVYTDESTAPNKLVVKTCFELSCVNNSTNIIPVPVTSDNPVSMELRDDMPLIARNVNGSIRYVKCNEISCSSNTEVIIDSSSPNAVFNSPSVDIELDVNGNPSFAYTFFDNLSGSIKFRSVNCNDNDCSNRSTRDFDAIIDPELDFNQQGHKVFVGRYNDSQLKLQVCTDQNCDNHSSKIIGDNVNPAQGSYHLGILSNNNPAIMYLDSQNILRYVICNDSLCNQISNGSFIGHNIALSFTVDGNHVEIATKEANGVSSFGRLRYMKCIPSNTNICATTITNTIADDGRGDARAYENIGEFSDIESIGDRVFVTHFNRTRDLQRYTYTY